MKPGDQVYRIIIACDKLFFYEGIVVENTSTVPSDPPLIVEIIKPTSLASCDKYDQDLSNWHPTLKEALLNHKQHASAMLQACRQTAIRHEKALKIINQELNDRNF